MRLSRKLVSALLFFTCIFSISVSAEVTVTMYLMSPKKSGDILNTVKNTPKEIGTITFKNSQYGGLMIIPNLHGLPVGMHGMHLHAALAFQAKEEGVSLNMLAATLLAEGIGKKITTKQRNHRG